ncbi:MAG: hypothetical protein WDN69_31875 [Aliidongia sp.]
MLAAVMQQHAQAMLRMGVARLQCQRLPIEFLRLIQPSGLVIR